MPADNNTFWASILGSPIYNPGSLSIGAYTGVGQYGPSGNFIGITPNQTVSSATQNDAGEPVFSESVNLGQVGILNSGIFAGLDAAITVSQLGSTTSTATNVASGGNAYAGAVQNFDIPYSTQFPGTAPVQGFLANAGGGIINSEGYNPTASNWSLLGAGVNPNPNPYVPAGYGASDIVIGRQGQINISVGNNVTATAQAAGGADPSGDAIGDWAVFFNNTNPLSAAGGAVAAAAPGNTYGLFNTSVFVGGAIGATNTLNSSLAGNTSAVAKLGEEVDEAFNGGIGDAVAQAGLDGYYNDQYTAINSGGTLLDISGATFPDPSGAGPMVLSFGLGNTTVSGRVTQVGVNAEAQTGTGDATATALADEFGGITQSGSIFGEDATATTGLQILIGGNGNVTGTALGSTNAVALTEEGSATATTEVDQVFGIVDNNQVLNWASTDISGAYVFGSTLPGSGSAVLIDGAGTIAAGASVASNAYAQTTGATDVSGGATATTDNNFVVGLSQGGIVDPSAALFPSIPGLTGRTPGVGIAGDGNLRVFADSTQSATAVSDFTVDPSGFVDPLATSAEGDLVVGILDTDIVIGDDLTSLSVASQLNAQSNAFSNGDVATAESGNGSGNVGILDSTLLVGGDANYAYQPASINPANNYTLDPSRNEGPINVYAETSLITYAGTAGLNPSGGGYSSTATTGVESLTAGMNGSMIGIGGDGTIISKADVTLGANAGVAYEVDISGNVDTDPSGVLGLAGSDATASVGPATSAGILDSSIKILGGTLNPATGRLSTIVQGDSTVDASANAFTLGTDISGAQALASVQLGSSGIALTDPAGDVISIAREGNVAGSSVVTGGVDSVNQGSQTNDIADAFANIRSEGIYVGAGSVIDIGRSGSIFGSGTIGAAATPYAVNAVSTAGDADASGNFDVFGISGAGTVSPGALSGNVQGLAYANTRVDAEAASGAANAVNTVDGVGIALASGLQMAQNSTITAVSQIFNTVEALNANGTATALANTSSVGIQGTPISFNGGVGSIFVNAGGESRATSGITPL